MSKYLVGSTVKRKAAAARPLSRTHADGGHATTSEPSSGCWNDTTMNSKRRGERVFLYSLL